MTAFRTGFIILVVVAALITVPVVIAVQRHSLSPTVAAFIGLATAIPIAIFVWRHRGASERTVDTSQFILMVLWPALVWAVALAVKWKGILSNDDVDSVSTIVALAGYILVFRKIKRHPST